MVCDHEKLLRQRSTSHGCLGSPRLLMRALLLSMFFLAPAHRAAAGAADDLVRLADTMAAAPHQSRADLIRERYRAIHGPVRPDQLATAGLLTRFKAAEIAAFYSHDPGIALELRDIYVQLRAHRMADASHAESVLATLVQAREFEIAHAFNNQEKVVPGESLVRLAYALAPEAARRTVLDVKGAELTPRGVDVSTGLRILAVAHPDCGYSRQAADAIDADDALRELFERHALWITPPTRDLTNEGANKWNDERPGQRLQVTYRTSDWPEISDWSTPMFYVLRDGQLVRTLAGWPKDGATHRQLRELLHFGPVARP